MSKYKRSGTFDQQRKQLLENFKQSETHKNLLLKLQLMVDNKVKKDPSILAKNRGKMGALIQGEIVNQHSTGKEAGLLGIVDKDIQEKIIESPEFRSLIKTELKDIRRKLLAISDEDYEKLLEEERQQSAQSEQEERKPSVEHERDSYNFKVKKPGNKQFKVPRIKLAQREERKEEKEAHPLMY